MDQQTIAQNIVAQLRLLAPSMGAQPGTPEGLLIDAISAAIADASISINALAGTLDINSKTGDNLDRFLSLFGFARQTSTQATGFVTFSCNTSPLQDIIIPANIQVFATLSSPANNTGSATSIIYFLTQFQGTIPAGSNPAQVTVPIIAAIGGASGNVAANTITSFGTAPVFGVTAVTNETATTGGIDSESDAEYQTRFQNTVFRNLAGTKDQYLGLIASTPYTTQAQVIGPISRYQEYIQIPPVDDTQSYNFSNAPVVQPLPNVPVAQPLDLVVAIGGNSTVSGNYTTALSTVPNSQYIYTSVPNFTTNGQQGASAVFYREGIDWFLNTDPRDKNRGDAYRFWQAGLPGAPDPLSVGNPTLFQPNVTFTNVYTANDTNVSLVQPEQVVMFEHAYLSSASRNNVIAGLTNAVDIYIDGSNNVTSNTTLALTDLPLVFNNVPGTFLTNTNYHRFGQANQNPIAGNYFFPLYNEPVTSLPSQITVNGVTVSGTQQTTFYTLGTNYWLVQDVTNLFGTVRCRNGIEWDSASTGNITSIGDGPPLNQYNSGTNFNVIGYSYDKNIVDLQSMCEASKQITTDVLVHNAYPRYFKCDITVVYSPGSSPGIVNSSIQSSVQKYFTRQTFGSLIETGQIIQVVFAVPGVQNARWSADLPFGPQTSDHRVIECDINGNPLSSTSYFDVDFFIGDDQLAYTPTGMVVQDVSGNFVTDSDPPEAVTNQSFVDTLPGLIIRARAENSWTRGPFNPLFGKNLPVEPPD